MDTTKNNGQTGYFIGIDQHRDFSQVIVKDRDGVVLDKQKLYHEDKDVMQDYFKQFPSEHTRVALEATSSWYWLYDFLESCNLPVELAHPLKVKLIAESTIKTDKIDAGTLADLLRTNYLPTAYIPSKETRTLRERLRHRIVLVHLRTSVKNRVKSVLAKLGISIPDEFSHLYTQEGKKWLRGLKLPDPYQLEINNYLELVECFTRLIQGLDRQIEQYLVQDPRAEYLMSIPGIGDFTAYLILAEIGDIARFSSPKKLTSYAGLVPSVNQSGKHIYFGRITKQGNVYLRFGLVEAAHIAVQHDPYFEERYQRLRMVKGSGKAATAIARELLEIVYWVLKEQRTYYRSDLRRKRKELVEVTGQACVSPWSK